MKIIINHKFAVSFLYLGKADNFTDSYATKDIGLKKILKYPFGLIKEAK